MPLIQVLPYRMIVWRSGAVTERVSEHQLRHKLIVGAIWRIAFEDNVVVNLVVDDLLQNLVMSHHFKCRLDF